MFTGIIKETVKVRKVEFPTGGLKLFLARPRGRKIKIGSSVSVNGVCSTVNGESGGLVFNYMPETLARSNLSFLKKNDIVNLEFSLKASDRLDGHIVTGHVDCTGRLQSVKREGDSSVLRIKFPPSFAELAAEKGSVAVNGVSLTITKVGRRYLTVKITPYTCRQTNLGEEKSGERLNLEFDILAKYLKRIIYARGQ